MKHRITLPAVTRQLDDGRTVTTFVASTATPDRMGDVVDQASWKLEAYRSNPVILWAHDYSQPPVGRAVRAEVVHHEGGARLEIDVEWDEGGAAGSEVARQYREGFLSAGSVGFAPGLSIQRNVLPADDPRYSAEYGRVYLDNELLEFSAVPVPANPEALAARTLTQRDELLRILQTDPDVQALIQRLSDDEPEPAGDWFQDDATATDWF